MTEVDSKDDIDVIELGDFLEERIAAWGSDMREGKTTRPLADHLASYLLAGESPVANVLTTIREDIAYINRIDVKYTEAVEEIDRLERGIARAIGELTDRQGDTAAIRATRKILRAHSVLSGLVSS